MPKIIKYTDDLAREICEEVATCALSLRILCKKYPHWPKQTTIRKWIREDARFATLYARAKLDQADYLAEEILEISDNSSNDSSVKIAKDGHEYRSCNNEWINRSRLRVDTRKWLASKFAPKIYGDMASKNISSDDAISEFRIENE